MHPFQQKSKLKVDTHSLDKSSKTNPICESQPKIKAHSRTKSDAILRNSKLMSKFVEDIQSKVNNNSNKRKNSNANSDLLVRNLKNIFDFNMLKNKFKNSFSATKSRKTDSVYYRSNFKPNNQEITSQNDFDVTKKTEIDNTVSRDEVIHHDNTSKEFGGRNGLSHLPMAINDNIYLNKQQNISNMNFRTSIDKSKLLCTINAHLDSVNKIECVNNSTLATYSSDGCVKLWNIRGSEQLPLIHEGGTFRHHTAEILSSAASDKFIFSGDNRGLINVLKKSTENWDLYRTFKTGPEPVWSISFNSTNNLLASSTPGKLKLWNVNQISSKQDNVLINTNSSLLGTCHWHADSDLIVHSYEDKKSHNEFRLFDVIKNVQKEKISQLTIFSNQFCLSEDSMILSANNDHTVTMHDIKSRCLIDKFVAHSDRVTSIYYEDNKKLVITGSSDGSLRLWDIRNLKCLQEFSVHRKKYDESIFDIKSFRISNLIVSAGADATVRFFQLF